MYETLLALAVKPELFSRSTALELWTHPHVAQRMLAAHLDPKQNRASNTAEAIQSTVTWINKQFALKNKRVCDLGCGPGLYSAAFSSLGADVIGIDFSSSSIQYAKKQDPGIDYRQQNYLDEELPSNVDLFTLIFCDYCVLSSENRQLLLGKIKSSLNPSGRFLMDVYSCASFDHFQEKTLIQSQLMNGFWSDQPYVGILRSHRYDEHCVSLDHYLIVEASQRREIYNWIQYFSLQSITDELAESGLRIEHVFADLEGNAYELASPEISLVIAPA